MFSLFNKFIQASSSTSNRLLYCIQNTYRNIIQYVFFWIFDLSYVCTKCPESILHNRSKIDENKFLSRGIILFQFRIVIFDASLYVRKHVYVDTLGRRLSTVSATAGLSFCPRSSVNTMINMRHLAFHQTQRLSLFQNQLPLGSRRARTQGYSVPPVFIAPLAINSISCLLNVQHAAHAVPNFY